MGQRVAEETHPVCHNDGSPGRQVLVSQVMGLKVQQDSIWQTSNVQKHVLVCLGCPLSMRDLQDDMGVEGVIILPDSKVKEVKIGSRSSTARVRREEYADAREAAAAHEKAKAKQTVEVNTKDCKPSNTLAPHVLSLVLPKALFVFVSTCFEKTCMALVPHSW